MQNQAMATQGTATGAPGHAMDLGPEKLDAADQVAYLRGMERLMRAVTDLASARSLEEIADIVRHAARDLSQADGATFVLRDSGKCYYMDEDAIAPLWRGLRFPMETCISGWAMLNRQGVVIPDIYADDRIPHDAYRPTFVKSLAISPIRTAEPIGAIGSYWADHHEATATERRLLQALADSTAVALESVYTLTELEARVEERTAKLAQANSDLQRFAASAAHDLRSPLTMVVAYAGVLAEHLGPQEGVVDTAIGGIRRSGARLLSLIDELLQFARAGSAEVARSSVDLDAMVQDVLDELHPRIEETGATLQVAPLGRVEADGALLHQAVQNLVVNALTHVSDDVTPVVRIDVERADGSVALIVADNGPGVPLEDRARLVEPFERGGDAAGRAGTGLGLAICQRVAEHHGGGLHIGDSPDGGATFTIVLPMAPPDPG